MTVPGLSVAIGGVRADRVLRRLSALAHDPHVLVAAALSGTAMAVAALSAEIDFAPVGALGGFYLALQAALGLPWARRLAGRGALALPMFRLLVAVGAVTALALAIGWARGGVLYIPIVALAAAVGTREGVVTGTLAGLAYLAPAVAHPGRFDDAALGGLAFAAVAAILAVGTRREVAVLSETFTRLRRAMAAERRQRAQMAALEAVGTLLASRGPTPAALDQVVALLESRFGYEFVSIYLGGGPVLRLGAQRGYRTVYETLDATGGVVGRVIRTHRPELVRDVRRDPDYRSADERVRSEICVPLLAQGELVGVLNVESASETPLDERDLRLLVTVADRLAVAVALGRERQAVDERARLFRGLTEFAARIGGTLQADALYATIVEVVGEALPGSISVLTVIEPATGRYLIRSGPESVGAPGIEIRPGEGIAGRAIRDRTIVAVERFGRDDAPAELRDRLPHDLAMAAAGAPLVREGAVIGALTVLRPGDPFSPTELEVIDLLARQAALAVANTLLHAEIADLAIRDPLTGLFNRRHFDAALDRLIAAHLRRPPKQRALSVILFDLDEFGAFNKLHGHQAGDAVLRAFGELLAGRFRASDVVARYGGEEFVVVLDGAPREAALEVAEEVRTRFEALEIEGPDGPLRATVSAGCAALDETTRTREALLRAADVGLFMAKRAGRNRVVAA